MERRDEWAKGIEDDQDDEVKAACAYEYARIHTHTTLTHTPIDEDSVDTVCSKNTPEEIQLSLSMSRYI